MMLSLAAGDGCLLEHGRPLSGLKAALLPLLHVCWAGWLLRCWPLLALACLTPAMQWGGLALGWDRL